MECPICYEAITADTGIVTTSCKHSYHFSCISGWYINQEKGTCPCCRKEMSEKEDFPVHEEAESDSESESEFDEVEFTRSELQEFIKSHGGNLTEQMSDAICAVVGAFTQTELNSLLVGNTGQALTEEEWNELLTRPETVLDSDVHSMRISLEGDERNVYLFPSHMHEHEMAASTIQSAWRIRQAAHALLMLKN